MTKARQIILSVTLEGRSQADTARLYDVSESWVSKLLRRYRLEGPAAFEPKSRRPNTSPTRTPIPVINLIIELRKQLTTKGLDNGPETIAWHLNTHHDLTISTATIRRHLHHAGLITPQPHKRPKSSYIRFQDPLPNGTWQTDMTHWQANPTLHTELLSFIDDHSRYALSVAAYVTVKGPDVVHQFNKTTSNSGIPASVLSDNGLIFTTRFAGGGKGKNQFERKLAQLGVTQKNSSPGRPTTCGKVERFQQTLKKWLRAQPPPTTITQLQTQLDEFIDEYNHHRPHRSLGRRTPTVVYNLLPKDHPTKPKDQLRIRNDKVDKTGCVTLRYNSRLHHIGIGRTHAQTPIILLINDRDIRIINTTTGEQLRRLTLDPTVDYQRLNPKT